MNEHESRFGGSGSGRLDRAIDRAVRDLMWIDPPSGLRRRVLSRLEAPVRASGFPRFAVLAAALAVLVVAAVLLRESGSRPPVGQPSVVATTSPAVVQPANSPVSQPSQPTPAASRTPPRRDE